MSTKIGVIAEGPIDRALLGPLLEQVARVRADYRWPVEDADVTEILTIRKRGHGGVLEAVRRLVGVLEKGDYPHAFFVILLDRRTRAVQDEIRKLIGVRRRFVLGVAIEEIEAWWLGDRTNTLQWSGLEGSLPVNARYAAPKYKAERDDDPKRTLDEITRVSNRIDRYYGEGSVDLALDFGEEYWRRGARLDEIKTQCPQGYGRFEGRVTTQFRTAKRRTGRTR